MIINHEKCPLDDTTGASLGIMSDLFGIGQFEPGSHRSPLMSAMSSKGHQSDAWTLNWKYPHMRNVLQLWGRPIIHHPVDFKLPIMWAITIAEREASRTSCDSVMSVSAEEEDSVAKEAQQVEFIKPLLLLGVRCLFSAPSSHRDSSQTVINENTKNCFCFSFFRSWICRLSEIPRFVCFVSILLRVSAGLGEFRCFA